MKRTVNDQLSRVDLNLLTALEALLDEQSVSRAASRLFIGQPAMSHHLARLRELFDDPLLVRQGSRMVPTYRAQELKPVLADILHRVRHQLLQPPLFMSQDYTGHLRIGMSDYVESLYADAILTGITESAPQASVSFLLVDRHTALQQLRDGTLDMAIGHWPSPTQTIETQTLYRERHICLFDNHKLKLTLPLSYKDFVTIDHALINNTGVTSGPVDELLQEGDQRRVRVTCGRFTSLLRLLSGQKLLAVVPEVLAMLDFQGSHLTMSPCPVPVSDFDIQLAWREDHSQSQVISWLGNLLSDTVLKRRSVLQEQ